MTVAIISYILPRTAYSLNVVGMKSIWSLLRFSHFPRQLDTNVFLSYGIYEYYCHVVWVWHVGRLLIMLEAYLMMDGMELIYEYLC